VKKTEPPNQEEFDALLAWLDPDRDRAGVILYEEIRVKLVKIMERRQCWAADELADETINRVSHKVKDIAPTYVGNPALYFYAVLRKVYQEWLRDPQPDPLPPDPLPEPDPREDIERIHDCLQMCLKELDPADHGLILKYYEKDKGAKIDHRKELAESRGLTQNALRMRVHRINAVLYKCIVKCLDETEAT
jgi:DNA-directed RNA polymerase specialized sigma24 family protein